MIQQFFLRAPPAFHDRLMNAILHEAHLLITNPFGNYVIQVLASLAFHRSSCWSEAVPTSASC